MLDLRLWATRYLPFQGKFLAMKRLKLLFSLLVASFSFTCNSVIAAEDFFFFPYTSCLRVKVEDDFHMQANQLVIIRGELLESLREKFPKDLYNYTNDGKIGLVVYKAPAYVFGSQPKQSLEGREVVLAFNGDTRDGNGIRNMYDPFHGKPFSKDELEQLRSDLKKKSFFPFSACLQITVKEVKEDKAKKKLYLKALINKAVVADTYGDYEKSQMPPKEEPYYANFKDGQLANFDINLDNWCPYFSGLKLDQIIGKSFLWSFNTLKSDAPNVFHASSIRTELIDEKTIDKIAEIKKEVSLLPKKMPALKSAVQANMEMRWPLERIKMYLKNPIALTPEKEKDEFFGSGEKFMLSGTLHPERESEIGKIVWTANLFPDTYNRYSVKLIKNSKTYLLDHDWISLVPLAPDEAEICLLKKVLAQIHSTCDCKRKDWNYEYPNHLYGEILSNESGKRTYKAHLNGNKILTATFNENLHFTEIFVNGKFDTDWNNALQTVSEKVKVVFD